MRRKLFLFFILAIIALSGYFIYSYYGENVYTVPEVYDEVVIAPRNDIALDNPYDKVKWDSYGMYKANLHTHTRESDGLYSPGRVIDTYKENGYDILALADHNHVTWPWQDYGRNPDELGMLAVQANEISDTHHIGSYFSDYDIDGMKYRPILWKTGEKADIDEEEVIKNIGDKNGLAVFFHPGRYDYTPDFYRNFYLEHDHLIGMEVINQRDRYPYDREIWDDVLTLLMPERPVWGFSNDDMHTMGHLGYCYNIFPLPELSEESFRDAMENGQFYFSYGKEAPEIKSLELDNDEGLIRIEATGWNEIVWYSDSRVIHHGSTLNFREIPNVGSYVRAKIMGNSGNTYTNPFGVRNIF